MATNLYFTQGTKSEQSLYEDIIIESLKIYGQDIYYLPREIINEDKILGEDVPSRFSSSYKIEMYIENTDGFDGQGDLFTKFGVEIRDQATFIVAKRRWRHVIGQMDNDIESERPREGDLIYLPLSKSMFQIMKVEHEKPFYQLQDLPIYKMNCELFEYNDEDFDTTIPDIDNIETLGYNVELILFPGDSDDIADVKVGEVVYQELSNGIRVFGEVVDYNRGENIVTLSHIGADGGEYGMFEPGVLTIPQFGSEAFQNEYIVDRLRTILQVNERVSSDSSYSQNDIFDTEKNNLVMDFLDFSEDNPFGDPRDT